MEEGLGRGIHRWDDQLSISLLGSILAVLTCVKILREVLYVESGVEMGPLINMVSSKNCEKEAILNNGSSLNYRFNMSRSISPFASL